MDTLQFGLTLAAKGAVVLVMTALASALFARSSAALRHLSWSVGLVALLILPALAFILPDLPVGEWQPVARAWTPVAARPAQAPVGPYVIDAAPPAEPGPITAAAPGTPAPAAEIDPTPAIAAAPSVTAAAVSPVLPSLPGLTTRLLQIWAVGAVVLLAWLALGHARAARLARRATSDLSPEWDELIDEAADLAGLGTPVLVRETADLTVPATVGIFRPVVLVPAAGVEWSYHHRRDVLIHEFAHVVRRDCLTHSLGWIACALHWINPLAWVALWRTRVEREHACDDIVLRAGARPSDYAEELLQTAHLARVPFATGATSLAMARRSQLSTRLLAILDAGRHRNPISTAAAAGLGFGAALVVLPLAALAPAAAESTEHLGPAVAIDVMGDAVTPGAFMAPSDLAPVGEGPEAGVASAGPVLAAVSDLIVAGTDETASVPLELRPVAGLPLPVVAASQVQGQQLCQTSRTGRNRNVKVGRSMSFSGSGNGEDGDGNSYVVWSGPDCSVIIHVVGRVRFTEDETDVASVSRGGRFDVTHSVGDRERRYSVRMSNGELERSYTMDGRAAPIDPEAERWRSVVVLEYIRRSGHDAEDRARRILARSGVDGVLNEIAQIGSDWAGTKYYMALLASARMDDATTARLITAAGTGLESDHYRAQVLGAVPASSLSGAQTRTAYVASSEKIESDHYLTQTLARVLASGSLDAEATRSLLARAARMESDHYLATLLGGLVGTGLVRGELLTDYLAAARQIESDHYKAQVLGRLVPEFAGQPALLQSALDAARSIESDHYLGELLKQVLMAKTLAGSAIEPFFAAAKTVESDHYRTMVLVAALGRSDDPEVVTRTLEAAPSIESDHYLAELLLAAKRRGLTEQQQALWKKAAESIESDHYYGKVVRQ